MGDLKPSSDTAIFISPSPPPPLPPPPPPPPPFGLAAARAPVLPQQQTPRPRAPMKHLPWSKIPSTQVVGSTNLWSELGRAFDGYQMNYDQIEELFAVKQQQQQQQRPQDDIDGSLEEQVTCKKRMEVHLIENKRSMQINIFLRQFSGLSPADVVQRLCSGNAGGQLLGPDRLRSLQKLLPEPDEVDRLIQYTGDKDCLGTAEQFYLELIAIPNYELLVDALLIKEEFQETLDRIKTALDAIIVSAEEIKQNKALRKLIYMVLITGNFLNSGHYGGDAAGFRLNSLLNLTDIRSNKPGMNLMHYVAQEAAEKHPELMLEVKELKDLQEASVYPLESLTADIKLLQQGVTSVLEHVSQSDSEFCQQMLPFFESADEDLKLLSDDMKLIETLRLDLARHFCEDVTSFKIDDCIATFNAFCLKFLRAYEENNERANQQQQAEQRRRQREQRSRDTASGEFDHSATDFRSRETSTPPPHVTSQQSHAVLTRTSGTSKQPDVGSNQQSRDAQHDLEQYLMRAVDGRRSGRRSRSSNRLSAEIAFSRERSSSPSSKSILADDAVSTPGHAALDRRPTSRDLNRIVDEVGDGKDGGTALTRGTSARSSCPSRVASSTRRQQSQASTASSSVMPPLAASTAVTGTSGTIEAVPSSDVAVSTPSNVPWSLADVGSSTNKTERPLTRERLRKKDSLGVERPVGGLRVMSADMSNSSIDLLNPCVRLLSGYTSQQEQLATTDDGLDRTDKSTTAVVANVSATDHVGQRHLDAVDNGGSVRKYSTVPNGLVAPSTRATLPLVDVVGRVPEDEFNSTRPSPSITNDDNGSKSSATSISGHQAKKSFEELSSSSPSTYSDSLQRKAAEVRKEKFKRLSELYSVEGDSETAGNTRNHQSPSTPNGMAPDMSRRSESVYSTSTTFSDEGFESDSCSNASIRGSVISHFDTDSSSTSSTTSSSSGSSATSGSVGTECNGRPPFPPGRRQPQVGSAKDVVKTRISGTPSVGSGKGTSSVPSPLATSSRPSRGSKTTTAAAVSAARANVQNLSRRLSNFMISATTPSTTSTSQQRYGISGSTSSGMTSGGGTRKTVSNRPPAATRAVTITARSLSIPSSSLFKSSPPQQPASVGGAPSSASSRQSASIGGASRSSTTSTTPSTNVANVEQHPERPRKPRPPSVSSSSFVRGTATRSSGGASSKTALTPFVRSSASRSTLPANLVTSGSASTSNNVSRVGDVTNGVRNGSNNTTVTQHFQDDSNQSMSLYNISIGDFPSSSSATPLTTSGRSINQKSTTTGTSIAGEIARPSRRDVVGGSSVGTSSTRTHSSGGTSKLADQSPRRLVSSATYSASSSSSSSSVHREPVRSTATFGHTSMTSSQANAHQRQRNAVSGLSAVELQQQQQQQQQKPAMSVGRRSVETSRREHFV